LGGSANINWVNNRKTATGKILRLKNFI